MAGLCEGGNERPGCVKVLCNIGRKAMAVQEFLHGTKQIKILRCKVWTVWWMLEHLPTKCVDFQTNKSHNMGASIVMKKFDIVGINLTAFVTKGHDTTLPTFEYTRYRNELHHLMNAVLLDVICRMRYLYDGVPAHITLGVRPHLNPLFPKTWIGRGVYHGKRDNIQEIRCNQLIAAAKMVREQKISNYKATKQMDVS
ncbi:hypothetical protein ANN_00530 [Periplaneta americana]|uniref:Uncharacterized protein n=1 Tax=Periplaneta americana TaxID=6978 RepID=A0ABQ8TTY4_PERAM|nr:hypothetical protein ANN_00530 [Periplaneta americana]